MKLLQSILITVLIISAWLLKARIDEVFNYIEIGQAHVYYVENLVKKIASEIKELELTLENTKKILSSRIATNDADVQHLKDKIQRLQDEIEELKRKLQKLTGGKKWD